MAVSTVPQAKAKILDLLDARPGLAGVTRAYTYPADEASIGREHIHLGDVSQTEVWGAIGGQRRDEDFTIEIVILVRKFGDDPQATETRLWVLREEVATALRSDLTLSGILNQWCELTNTRVDQFPLTDGWTSRARLTVRCTARI